MINCRRFKRADRSTEPEKHFSLVALKSSVPQVAEQDICGLVTERQIECMLGFRLDDPQGAVSPVQILQFQVYQFCAAQSVSCRQVKECPVAPSLCLRWRDGSEQ